MRRIQYEGDDYDEKEEKSGKVCSEGVSSVVDVVVLGMVLLVDGVVVVHN